ncbi:MAG TPA: glycosyltransferase family 4 protein, partial [Gemmatales bacterium]|nr:glycosyltransferase family 4 protein [Gemmatales bacterium]
MKIALCYESMIPRMGGCETYIADLTRALVHDRHEVHLYACRIDNQAFPASVIHHLLPEPVGWRSQRVWRFASHCYQALQKERFDVSVGFIKTWGQDILMPQGGFHLASAEHNVRKHAHPLMRGLVRCLHTFDPKHRS